MARYVVDHGSRGPCLWKKGAEWQLLLQRCYVPIEVKCGYGDTEQSAANVLLILTPIGTRSHGEAVVESLRNTFRGVLCGIEPIPRRDRG